MRIDFPPDLPPVVYVPAEASSATGDFSAEYRLTKDGRKALLIYSAMDRLIKGMGPFQPWFVCEVGGLEELLKQDHFEVVYLDIAVPEDHRRKAVSA